MGECGLDYHYDHSPRRDQREVVRRPDRRWPTARPAARDPHPRGVGRHLRRARRRGRARAHGVPLLHRRTRRGRAVPRPRRPPVLLAASSPSRRADDVRAAAAAARSTGCWSRPTRPTWPRCPHRGRPNQPASCRSSAGPWPRCRGMRRRASSPRLVDQHRFYGFDGRGRPGRGRVAAGAGVRPGVTHSRRQLVGPARPPRPASSAGPWARTSWPTRTPCGASPGWPGSAPATAWSRSAPGSARSPWPWPRPAPGDRGRDRPPRPAACLRDGRGRAGRRADGGGGRRRCASTGSTPARDGRRAAGCWWPTCPTTSPPRWCSTCWTGCPPSSGCWCMVQREVGERLAAGPGDPAYGIPSVKVAYWADGRGGRPGAGHGVRAPTPGRVRRSSRSQRRPAAGPDVDRERLFALVRAGFGQRRKMLRRSLAGLVGDAAFAAAGVAPRGPGRGARRRGLGPPRPGGACRVAYRRARGLRPAPEAPSPTSPGSGRSHRRVLLGAENVTHRRRHPLPSGTRVRRPWTSSRPRPS